MLRAERVDFKRLVRPGSGTPFCDSQLMEEARDGHGGLGATGENPNRRIECLTPDLARPASWLALNGVS